MLSNVAVYATAPALILVGSMMLGNAAKIDWRNTQKAIPAFLTIILMPLLYSIAYGIIGAKKWCSGGILTAITILSLSPLFFLPSQVV